METKEEYKHDLTSDEALDNFIDPDSNHKLFRQHGCGNEWFGTFLQGE